jgi:vitamin B12 transporter
MQAGERSIISLFSRKKYKSKTREATQIMMFKNVKSFIVVGFCLFTNQIIAQTLLDEVTVTANKTEQKLSQTGKVVTVLTDSILQKYQGQSVAELLSRQAGFTIVGANGALGSNQEVYLRGASNGNTLVLIDGVPMYDPSYISSGFDLNLLNICECDRIEILKGAQSTLYGSDAVAGVINIFTKKGNSAKPISTLVSINGGSFGTFRNTLAVNGLIKKFYYDIQYSNLVSKGISAAYNKIDLLSSASPTVFDNDGFKQNNLMVNFGFNATEKLTFKFRGMLNNYKNDIDAGPFTDEKDYTSKQNLSMIGTSVDYKTANGKLVFNYNLAENKRIYTDDSTYIAPTAFDKYSKSTFGGVTQFSDIYWSNKVSDNFQFVVGSDFRKANLAQTYVSYSAYGKYEADPIGKDTSNTTINSIYGSGLISTKAFFLEIGGRFNSHSIYGKNFTYSFNPSYLLGKYVKTFLNISSGFKAPSLYQLYSPYGNKGLNPEKSTSSEIGLQLFSKNKNSNVRALYFARNLSDVIFFQAMSKSPYGKYINFDKQHDQGIEIEGNSQIGKLNIWGNYTYVTGKITQKDTTYNNLFRRPKNTINLGIGYQVSAKFYTSVSLKSLGERTDRFYNENTYGTENTVLKAYQTIDLYANYKISRSLKMYIDLKNITNQTYFDSYGYGTKPINFMAGVNFNF